MAQMDSVDLELLDALQEDARQSYAELGRRVALTPPAVAERIRRLEAAGVITGYHASVDLKAAGYGIVAIVRINASPELAPQLERLARETPEILEFHRVTGTEGFVAKLAVTSVEHLERLFGKLVPYGQTTTSIVLSSPVTWRKVSPAGS